MTGERKENEPTPPEHKDPEIHRVPEEKDPPQPQQEPFEMPTDPDIQEQEEIKLD